MSDVAVPGRPAAVRGGPFLARTEEAGVRQEAHPARVIHVEVGHDHPLDLGRLDAERAELRLVRLVRRFEGAEEQRHAHAEVPSPVVAHVRVQARVDEDRALGRVPHRIGEARHLHHLAARPKHRSEVGEPVPALGTEDVGVRGRDPAGDHHVELDGAHAPSIPAAH